MSNTVALAGAGGNMGSSVGTNGDLHALSGLRGRWQVACHSGRGWRGVLTRIRRELYRLADQRGRHAGRVLRTFGDIIARPALRWHDRIENIVVNAGLNYLLDTGLSAGVAITTWYLLLTDGTPTVAAGDTMASHAGWVEVTAYSEGVRQTWTDGGVASQSVDNSASAAVFTISSDTTVVGGAALTSVSTKGGTTGTLYAAGAFTAGDKSLDTSDTLTVTATFTAAAA